MSEYLLAVDGGGTKTAALSAEPSGHIMAEGGSGPSSLTATSLGAATFNLIEAVRQVTEPLPKDAVFPLIVIGLAGADTPTELAFAQQAFTDALTPYNIKKIIVLNDIRLILAAGTQQPNALALIAGTGSQCYGRNARGEEAKTSGLDFLLTDQGSGYEIGRSVLRTAAASFDGRIPKSILEEMVMAHYHVLHFPELKKEIYSPPLSKTQVAELAQLGLKAAEQGDQAAQTILREVVDDIDEMVSTVLRRLQLQTTPTELVCAGSVGTSPQIYPQYQQRLQQEFTQLTIKQLDHPPMHGALVLAQQMYR